ncbi:MAG: phosphoenolpyruvate--protein phosphotransferase [Deltaproteobacteria bacterium]|nr:phosphoenolpyruvate--protein phosphotransferase [Deltaproteobacteria bacterium]
MVFKDQSAKTFSHIARALKVSKHGERPLSRIVQIVREHFNANTCSLYELRRGSLTEVAADAEDSPEGDHVPEPQLKLAELAAKQGEAAFEGDIGAVPLVYQEKTVGILALQKPPGNDFPPMERRFLEFIALQVAGAIQSLTIAERAKSEIQEDRGVMVIQGIAVSTGFGIGPALFLHAGITSAGFAEPDPSLHSTKKEWERLESALRKTSEDLAVLERSVESDFSKNESNIFNSHRAILSDPDFLKNLKMEIDAGQGALKAVGEVLQAFMHSLAETKSSSIKETSVDLEELRQRLFENLMGMESRQEKENWSGILVAKSIGPSDTMRLDASKLLGIVTMTGGPTSHAAILARSLGIPAVMGAAGIMDKISPGSLLIVDGDTGEVIANPGPSILQQYEILEEKRVADLVTLNTIAYEPAVTMDGHPVHLEANASFATDVKRLRYFGAEGVGLFRTEFLFFKGKELPGETEQFEIYRRMIQDADGLPITFRILDAGGDKLIEALHMEKEENPILGYRSIRLTLSKPEILKTQFRALLRASAFGSLKILIPMISGMEEVDAIEGILAGVRKELSDEGIPYDPKIPFGLMIEVPSAVPMAPLLVQHADFLSIGTNDLTQYTLAVDRNNERVAPFFQSLHPAVLSFISQIASVGLKAKKPVGICGEMASDPQIIPLLVGLGVTHLSMIPSCLLEAKKIIRGMNYEECHEMARQTLQAARIDEVKTILANFRRY